jgi:hypothetical protein
MKTGAEVEAALAEAGAFLEFHRHELVKRDPLREQALYEIENGEPQGLFRDYVAGVLRKGSARRGKRGQSRLALQSRNRVIGEAVWLMTKRGFHPLRSPATRDQECAISIVTKALGKCGFAMSEDSVIKIWDAAPINPQNGSPKEK